MRPIGKKRPVLAGFKLKTTYWVIFVQIGVGGLTASLGDFQGGTDGRDSLVVVRSPSFLVRFWGTTPKFKFLAGNSNYWLAGICKIC